MIPSEEEAEKLNKAAEGLNQPMEEFGKSVIESILSMARLVDKLTPKNTPHDPRIRKNRRSW